MGLLQESVSCPYPLHSEDLGLTVPEHSRLSPTMAALPPVLTQYLVHPPHGMPSSSVLPYPLIPPSCPCLSEALPGILDGSGNCSYFHCKS